MVNKKTSKLSRGKTNVSKTKKEKTEPPIKQDEYGIFKEQCRIICHKVLAEKFSAPYADAVIQIDKAVDSYIDDHIHLPEECSIGHRKHRLKVARIQTAQDGYRLALAGGTRDGYEKIIQTFNKAFIVAARHGVRYDMHDAHRFIYEFLNYDIAKIDFPDDECAAVITHVSQVRDFCEHVNDIAPGIISDFVEG